MLSFSFQKAEECFSVPNSNGCHHKSFACTVVENGLQNKTSTVWGSPNIYVVLCIRKRPFRCTCRRRRESAMFSSEALGQQPGTNWDQESHCDASDPPVVCLRRRISRLAVTAAPPVTLVQTCRLLIWYGACMSKLCMSKLFIYPLLNSVMTGFAGH